MEMIDQGDISEVNSFKGKNGESYIRSNRDDDPTNNLDNLPSF
ncbi:DUF3892 domain-containing protein [Litchfieldia alkalitelluris]